MLAVDGTQAVPAALISTVLLVPPPGAGSVAENLTVTGFAYVRPGPGERTRLGHHWHLVGRGIERRIGCGERRDDAGRGFEILVARTHAEPRLYNIDHFRWLGVTTDDNMRLLFHKVFNSIQTSSG